MIQIDVMYGKTHSDEKVHLVLNAIDNVCHRTPSIWCNLKGGRMAQALLGAAGVRKPIIQHYKENSANDVAMTVARGIPNCTIRTSPQASKGSKATARDSWSGVVSSLARTESVLAQSSPEAKYLTAVTLASMFHRDNQCCVLRKATRDLVSL